jgi:hypothetical protein
MSGRLRWNEAWRQDGTARRGGTCSWAAGTIGAFAAIPNAGGRP